MARRLVAAGHHVHALADPTIGAAAEAVGCTFSAWRRADPHTRRLPSQAEVNEMAEGMELDGRHRATVEKIFTHPSGHNVQWHDVLSLLRSVAVVTAGPDGRYKVTLGSETETFEAPRGHDINEQQVVDLRRMLKGAGITPKSWKPPGSIDDSPGQTQ